MLVPQFFPTLPCRLELPSPDSESHMGNPWTLVPNLARNILGLAGSCQEGRWSWLPTLKATTSLASRRDLGSDVRHPAALELRPGGGGEYRAPGPESLKQMGCSSRKEAQRLGDQIRW